MAQSGCMGEGPSELSRKRDTARRGYLTATKQYLSSRSARQMVCRDGKAAMWRQFLHGAICRRFCHGLPKKRRYGKGSEGDRKTICQVWTESQRGEDTQSALQATAALRERSTGQAGNIRFPGVHDL